MSLPGSSAMPSPVTLHVYDLSQGMARQFSPALLGRVIDGIWHTGIVCFGFEYYFGQGIDRAYPAQTPFGRPLQVVPLGETHLTAHDFEEFLRQLEPRFNATTYHLLDNNCNNFTRECSLFLTGRDTPEHIWRLPQDVMNTPLGAMLRPLVDSVFARQAPSPTTMFAPSQGAPAQFGGIPTAGLSGTSAAAAAAAAGPPAARVLASPLDRRLNEAIVFRTANWDGLFMRLTGFLAASNSSAASLESTLRADLQAYATDHHDASKMPHPIEWYVDYLVRMVQDNILVDNEQFPVWDLLRILVLENDFAFQLDARSRGFLVDVLHHALADFDDAKKIDAANRLTLMRFFANATSVILSLARDHTSALIELSLKGIHAVGTNGFLRVVGAALANNIMMAVPDAARADASVELLSALVHALTSLVATTGLPSPTADGTAAGPSIQVSSSDRESAEYMLRALWMCVEVDRSQNLEIAAMLGFDPSAFTCSVVHAQQWGDTVAALASKFM